MQDHRCNNSYEQQQQQQQHSSPLPHPIAAQYAVAAAAALTSPFAQQQDDVLYLDGCDAGFRDPADGGLGCSLDGDELLFEPGSLTGVYSLNANSPTNNNMTVAADLNSSWAQLQGDGLLGSSLGAAVGLHWPGSQTLDQQQQQQQGLVRMPGSSIGSFNGQPMSSSMLQRGRWMAAASAPLPRLRPPTAPEFSRGANQMLLRQQSSSAASNVYGGYAQQPDTESEQMLGRSYQQQRLQQILEQILQQMQLDTASDQVLGSSYKRQQMQQLQQQMQLDRSSDQILGTSYRQLQQQLSGAQLQPAMCVACSPGTDCDAEVFLAGCYSPLTLACATSGMSANMNGSSSSGMPAFQLQQQQQNAGARVQARRMSNSGPLPSLPLSANEQQLHNQIGSSSSTMALQPLLSSSSNSAELQAVHAINAQLEQLLKLKEEVLAAKAAAAATAAPPSPLPATAPIAAYPAAATSADMLPVLGRMHSFPDQLRHNKQQQQQELGFGLDLQPQSQLLGTSLGSVSAVPASHHLALGMQTGTANLGNLPAATLDMPPRSRRSSSGSSIRPDQRHVVGSWAGDGRSNGQLFALEQARQKQAVRAVTEQKLQQLAAVQRMQLDLQQQLLEMLQ
jgi:hypothetical protein